MHVVGRTRNGRLVVFSDIGLARNSNPKDNEAHATFCMEQVEKCLLAYPNDTYVWVSDFHKFGESESVRREESVRFIREALSRTHGCDGICRSAEDF